MMKECQISLSIIIPVFNEAGTVATLIQSIRTVARRDWEVIVVDDGSTDQSVDTLRRECERAGFLLIEREQNGGKTAAVRTGLQRARGEYVIVQDADLEYEPQDIPKLLGAIESRGDVVYGRRPSCWNRPSRWLFASGVLLIDLALYLTYGRFVRDHATCYKLVPRRNLESFSLQSTGFEGCVEITAKLMRSQTPIRQVPIRYAPRASSEGKKLTALYGFRALRSVWKWRKWQPTAELVRRPSSETVGPVLSESHGSRHPTLARVGNQE